MNIYLSDKSCDLLKDENALRQKVAKFLAEPEQTQNVMVMTNLLLSGHKQDKVLVYDFMQFPFNWVSGVFTQLSFVYRRLWIAWFISIAFGMITAMASVTIFLSIILVAGSIFVFGKLHYYFLIKKFLHNLDLGLETDNLCAPNIVGVVILIVVELIMSFLVFGTIISILTAIFR